MKQTCPSAEQHGMFRLLSHLAVGSNQLKYKITRGEAVIRKQARKRQNVDPSFKN